jgi:hypothetical protein
MERICTCCHAVIAQDSQAARCPACGGDLVERRKIEESEANAAPSEVDHRGIVLPRRHALGGIITPQ